MLALTVALLRAGSLAEREPDRTATRELADELERLPGRATREPVRDTTPGDAQRRSPT
jgi:hypothetical protein